MKTGWFNRNMTGNTVKQESHRHSLASRGIKTTLPKGAKGFSSVGSPTPNFDMVKKDYLKAYRLGIKAYKDDIIRDPKSDKDFKDFLKYTKNSTPLLLSWVTGWDEAKYRHQKGETDMVSTPKDWVKMNWKDKKGKAFTSLIPKEGIKDAKYNVLLNGGFILNMDMIDKYDYNMGISKNALRTFFKKHTGKDVLKDMKFNVVTKFKDNANKIGHYNPDTNTLSIRKDQLSDLKNAVSVMAHEIVHKIGKNYDKTRAFENDLSYALGHAILD